MTLLRTNSPDLRTSERSWETNFRVLDDVCASLERMGVPKVGASRIGEYQRAFHALRDRPQLSVDGGARLLASMVDFHELRRIVAAAERSRQPDAWTDQLRRLPSGAAFTENADPTPDGRDIQFECFVAAVLELSGIDVAFREPDLVISAEGATIAIAAKRPRSERSLLKNLQRGISQVRKSGLPGIVALDLSTALHHGECVNSHDIAGGVQFLREAADSAVARLIPRVRNTARRANVFGVLGHLMLPVLNVGHADAPQTVTVVRWTLGHMLEEPGKWSQWADSVGAKWETGLQLPLDGDIPASTPAADVRE